MIKCPRLSYLYPFPEKNPKHNNPCWPPPKIFREIATNSFPPPCTFFLKKRKKYSERSEKSEHFVSQLTLSPHTPLIRKIIRENRSTWVKNLFLEIVENEFLK